MEKSQAQVSAQKIQKDLASLNPTAVISMFEIDITSLATDLGIISESQALDNPNLGIFRFHNNVKLFQTSIFWQDNEYIACPIEANEFEYNSEGTLPRPKIGITVSDQGISELTRLKQQLYLTGDLVGAKLTRIRTFLKYLDRKNFPEEVSVQLDPDPYAEFPREIYYFDRKSKEDKNTIEYELASIIDVEGIRLPGRLVLSNTCSFQYRGEGCCYEAETRRTTIHNSATLPIDAPPIANNRDEIIEEILGVPLVDRGEYNNNTTYKKGHYVYLSKNNVKYYFVASRDNPLAPPPNQNYWIADSCSRFISGCKLRYGSTGAVIPGGSGIVKGRLRTSAFPATSKLIR